MSEITPEQQKTLTKLAVLTGEGYGEMLVKVKEGRVVYIELKIGEQVAMEIKN